MADSKQVLKSMKKQQLENVCVVHGIECGTKQTKAQLVEKIEPVVSDTSTLDRFYPYMSGVETIFQKNFQKN